MESFKFELTLILLKPILSWGAGVSGFLHGCDCHEQQLLDGGKVDCIFKARRFPVWAACKYQGYLHAIRNCDVPLKFKQLQQGQNTPERHEALVWFILQFFACRNAVALRFEQGFEYCQDLPWYLVAMYVGEVLQTDDARLWQKNVARLHAPNMFQLKVI